MTADVDILLVDDRSQDLLAIEQLLGSRDYNLVRAQSGQEALRRVLERDFAVILVDVVMPVMDGFELVAIIKQRERSRHTPIIFLTAGGSDIHFIYRGYSVGAVDYLLKPLDADVLRAKVAIFVDLFRKGRQIREQADALRAAEHRERALELRAIREASEQRYRNLAEAIPEIVWTAAVDGAVMYFNRRWYEYTGQTIAAATGWGWLSAIAQTDAERCQQRWTEALAAGRGFELECRLRRRDGELSWHICRVVPELDERGQLVGWLGTYTECDALKRACDLAERAVLARDEFLSVASHELRTPLTTLQLRLQSLADDFGSDLADGTRRKLDSALRQGVRLMSVVDGVFDVSNLASGRVRLHREPLDLGELARDVIEQFSEAANLGGVSIELKCTPRTTGSWDRLRIEQIVRNLLSNAIKYAPNAPVQVSVEARDGCATLSVTDHGHGISLADQDRIFGPFERVVSAQNYGGLGLGLYVARQNAIAHGGSIHVTSAPGDGATFVLELPR